MGAVKNAITDHERKDWPAALNEAARDSLTTARWQRRARLAEKQYTIVVDALEQIAKVHVASWQQPAARIQDIAHDALGKVDVLQNEYDKETA
jgi:hypothetical protein